MKGKTGAIGLAILAAALYALSTPFSKLLLVHVTPTMLASLLYLGAGSGIAIMSLVVPKKWRQGEQRLARKDTPYVLGMILLDIAAPVLLMFGLKTATAANVSLLNNFEIVATSVIALVIFKEVITKKLWIAIALITASSLLLSFEDVSSFTFSLGSVLVILACLCWGLENNCTRKISGKSTFEIVILKGLFSGLGSLVIALILGERFPSWPWIALALALGFVAYGLSIFVYVRAQKDLGAAKTSACYAIAPFIGALLSFIVLHEPLTATYAVAALVMLGGTALVITDTLGKGQAEENRHD